MSQGRRGYSLMYRLGMPLWEIAPRTRCLGSGPTHINRRALDLVCGIGRHAVYLAQRGQDVGVDFAAPAVAQARRADQARVKAEFIVGDVTSANCGAGLSGGLDLCAGLGLARSWIRSPAPGRIGLVGYVDEPSRAGRDEGPLDVEAARISLAGRQITPAR